LIVKGSKEQGIGNRPAPVFPAHVDKTGCPIQPRFLRMGGKAIKLERYEFVFIDLAYLFVIREQGIASKQPGAVFSNP
jgi:hypothetical protein